MALKLQHEPFTVLKEEGLSCRQILEKRSRLRRVGPHTLEVSDVLMLPREDGFASSDLPFDDSQIALQAVEVHHEVTAKRIIMSG